MPTIYGSRSLFKTTIVGPAAAATILAALVQTCYAASDVFAVFKESGSIVSGSPIVALTVPPGRYAIFAKINVDQDDTTHHVTVECTLKAGGDLDLNVIRLQSSGTFRVDNGTIPLQIVESLARERAHDIVLSCTFAKLKSSLLSFRSARITALRLDGSLCDKANPAECI